MKRILVLVLLVVLIMSWEILGFFPKTAFAEEVDTSVEWQEILLPFNDEYKWITSIIIDPNDSKVIYVITLLDGVWKTINSGGEWTQVLYQEQTTFDCGALDQNNNILYVGSGSGRSGGGIFKSTDSGKNWIKLPINEAVQCLIVQDTLIYVGTWRGVFKSIDGGRTWKPMNKGLTTLLISTLAIDHQDTQIIYAGTWGQGIFKSIDGGENWTALDRGLLTPRVDSIAIDPTDSQIIYVGVGLHGDTPGKGIFKSTDGGKSWKAINKGLTCLSMRSDLVIDKQNTQIIYAGTQGGGVFKSTDGGENWMAINKGLTSLNIDSLMIDPTDSRVIYAGTFHPGGLFKLVVKIYKIIASSNTGGTISPSDTINLNYGESQTFTITSELGYKIKDVKVDGISVGAVTTYTLENVTSDHTIEVIFEPITFTITATAGLGGSISPSGTDTVNYGDSRTFIITPITGYKIKDVQVNGVSVGAVSTYTFTNVTIDHKIEAIFEPITFTITASAGINGSIFPSGTVSVNYDKSQTFIITPNIGSKIKDVKVDGISVGAVTTYTLENVTSDHTIEAIFEVKETVIVLQIGSPFFTVNGIMQILDSPPIIKNNRTLLPVRAVVEALEGIVSWNSTERKVTVSLGSTTIELWIGKSIAKVNGVNTPIDLTNPKVVPEIINSRTMLPLRFVTENLGCDVQWDGTTKTVTITYVP